MSLNLSLESNLKKITITLDKIRTKAMVTAARQGLNKTLSKMNTLSANAVKQRRNLKVGIIKRKFFTQIKAKGSTLDRLEASLIVSAKPISAITYIVGKREPRSQKGITIRKRKKVKVRIRPGKTTILPNAFLAKGKSGNTQIFRRKKRGKGSTSLPIKKLSSPALSTLFDDKKFRTPLERASARIMVKEFNRAFTNQLKRLGAK